MTTVRTDVYRADVVGSLIRSSEFVEARAAFREGRLPETDFREIEDREVDAALRVQEEAGVDVATDGEIRRDIFFEFFVTAMTGLSPIPAGRVTFHGKRPEDWMEVPIPFSVTDRISALPCPAVAEYRYASERSNLPMKVTLPSPMIMLEFWSDVSKDAYPAPFDLVADATEAVRGWVRELVEAGCSYIQIDAPEMAEIFADDGVRDYFRDRDISPEEYMAVGTELVGSIGDVPRGDARLGLHLCKGNGTQAWIAEGGYDDLAATMFARCAGYDVFHLEYDDERSGSFAALGELPDDRVAVLGMVSTKWTALEDPAVLRARIEEAAQFHPLDRLALATQCGFASASETAEQRKLASDTQSAKLRLVAEVARSVWG